MSQSSFRSRIGHLALAIVTIAAMVSAVIVQPHSALAASQLHWLYASGSATGGKSISLRVTLSEPAPTGGAVVALTSNSPLIPVPSTVLVPAGTSQRTIHVKTVPTPVNTNVVVTASYGGASHSKTIMVKLPYLSSVTAQSKIRSGGNGKIIVRLSGRAFTGGITVAMNSNRPSILPVPATVFIPAGQASYILIVPAALVTHDVPVNITARYDGNRITKGTIVRLYATATPTVTNTPIDTVTNTPVDTSTNTPVDTATNTPVDTATNTPVDTATSTATDVPTATATATDVPTATETATDVPTATETATDVPTATETSTDVPTATETATDVPTATETSTDVPTATETATDVPTATETSTDVPTATETATDVPTATETATDVPTATETATDVPTATETATDVPTATETATDVPTATETATDVPTATETATDVPTATETATDVPTATETATDVPTATETATDVPTATETATDVPTATETATDVPTATETATDVPTATETATDVPTATSTATDVPTNTPVPPTVTPTFTPSPTGTPVPPVLVISRSDSGNVDNGKDATFHICITGGTMPVTVYFRASDPNLAVPQGTSATFSQGSPSNGCIDVSLHNQSGGSSGNTTLQVWTAATGGVKIFETAPVHMN